jgi:hypothetical protein
VFPVHARNDGIERLDLVVEVLELRAQRGGQLAHHRRQDYRFRIRTRHRRHPEYGS